MDEEPNATPPPPIDLDAARKGRKTKGAGGGGGKDDGEIKVRKHRLSPKEIAAIEKKYGLETDGLPLDKAGHAVRVFTMAEASGTLILLGTDNRWRIYDPATGRWLDDAIVNHRFNGYVIQVGTLMLQNATTLRLKLDAGAVPDADKAKVEKLIEIYEMEGKGLRNSQTAVRMVSAAKATEEQRHMVEPSEFDSDRDRILVRNGLIDLPTGKLLQHGPEHKFTRWINLDFDPGADAPTFDAFLTYVLPDADVREWVQRFAGYALTGYTEEQLMTILIGTTGTGKSSLVKLIARTMGSVGHHGYARKVPEGLFRKNMSHWGDSARLMATRFAYDSEFEQDTVLNAERIRVLTGEDEVDGNEKMRAFKYFDLLAKFMISTNVMPPMSSRDPLAVREATLRRLAIVPMNQALTDRWGRDDLPTLFAALNAEHEGILAWMVVGARAWYAKPLSIDMPEAMVIARSTYGEQSGIVDPIAAALAAAGFVLDPALKTPAGVLNAALPEVGATALGLWLGNHGCTRKKSGVVHWFGVGQPQ